MKPGDDLQPDEIRLKSLAQRACQSDREAFGGLFRLYYPRVHRTVWGMLGDESEAHDVAQDAWIKAWDKRTDFNFQSQYSTWVHRIAVNCALDALRRRKRLSRRIVSFFSSSEDESLPDPEDTVAYHQPDFMTANKELGESIEKAVADLPDAQRIVLVLREYEGCRYAEIADLLKIEIGTVMSRLHLARKKLQNSLKKEL